MMAKRRVTSMARPTQYAYQYWAAGNNRAVIQKEQCSFLHRLKQGVGEEHRKLAKPAFSNHGHGNADLKDVGCDPQVMPQE